MLSNMNLNQLAVETVDNTSKLFAKKFAKHLFGCPSDKKQYQ